MKLCPITYEPIKHPAKYSSKGLHRLSPALNALKDLAYTAEELRREAEARSTKLSIQGVQPKLSAGLDIKNRALRIVDGGGRYILKPQTDSYKELPQNEDLTMRLASMCGIDVPLHGLIYAKDNSLTYFVRRFDREGQKGKLHVEDFAQLSEESRDTKYNSSMERVADVIDFCTFPAVEKLKLFKRTVFSFLVGNEDMHLKNFSLLVREGVTALSPAYDLVNTTLVLASPMEELALPIRGKKRNLTRRDFVDYFAFERLGIAPAACEAVLTELKESLPRWKKLISVSFLSQASKNRYLAIVTERAARLGIGAVHRPH